jgi:hypothetical protein
MRKKPFKVPAGHALALRTCNADMTSHGGFLWPTSGPVSAPDWQADKNCGHGLHGLLHGEGNAQLLNWADDAVWLAVLVKLADVIDLEGKVKFPAGEVVKVGTREEVVAFIQQHHPNYATVCGTATAGVCGTATAGDSGTATAGYSGTATAGYSGTATAGDSGTATAGYSGTATAGVCGTATAGDSGTATAGYSGTATAGVCGTATAGDSGTVIIKWWDEDAKRYRFSIGYIGEDGLKPGVRYKLDDKHQFVEVQS